jgi:hypothetical protein
MSQNRKAINAFRIFARNQISKSTDTTDDNIKIDLKSALLNRDSEQIMGWSTRESGFKSRGFTALTTATLLPAQVFIQGCHAVSAEQNDLGVKLTTHLSLVVRLM